MSKHKNPMTFLFLFSLYFFSALNVQLTGGKLITGEKNPFTPKASFIRYWEKEILSESPKPYFLTLKVSPLTSVESASFAKLAAANSLSTRLSEFCYAAKLFCFPDSTPNLEKHDRDSTFATYSQKNFTNYGTARPGGVNTFKNYSDDENVIVDSFRRYSRDTAGHDDRFSHYAPDGNVVDESFNTYGAAATGGAGDFVNYQQRVNNPNDRFVSYSDDSNGRSQSFTTYTNQANAGPGQSFTSYGKNGNGAPNKFSSYGTSSNVIGSDFSGYGKNANVNEDTFVTYGEDANVPQNTFKNYGDGGNSASDTFTSYRDKSNVGDDTFKTYAKDSNAAKVDFTNYGQSFNEGTDKFTGYGEGAQNQKIGFKIYGLNTTFKDYKQKSTVAFAKYKMTSNSAKMAASGSSVNKWVEPGKFFRESMLKEGTVMPMPDIEDKMPKRSFLPRTISSKLPFSTTKIDELKQIFHAIDNSSMEGIIVNAIKECESAPTVGETKRCVGSAEDMIDFATSVLGRSIVVRTTDNIKGSNQNIMIGTVKGINGGKVTKSVSCHQSLYPYLLYYCHSVPKVRVYEADILDPKTKIKINHGVSICHLDTSAWSQSHGAFSALGSGPGRIEVCHWIFENDMTWAVAD